jgi:hypothetical protein
MSVLTAAGYAFVPAGTTLRFTADVSNGKSRVTEIHAIDTSTAEPGEPPAVRTRRDHESIAS